MSSLAHPINKCMHTCWSHLGSALLLVRCCEVYCGLALLICTTNESKAATTCNLIFDLSSKTSRYPYLFMSMPSVVFQGRMGQGSFITTHENLPSHRQPTYAIRRSRTRTVRFHMLSIMLIRPSRSFPLALEVVTVHVDPVVTHVFGLTIAMPAKTFGPAHWQVHLRET